MTAAPVDNLLGLGIYSPAEAAFYAKIRTVKMSRWLFGNKSGDSVVQSQIDATLGGEKIVTFLDFIQSLAIRSILAKHPKMSLQKIRDAVDYAKNTYGFQFPLARPHKTWMMADDHLLIAINNDHVDNHVVEIGKGHRGQRVAYEIVEPYLEDVTIDSDTGFVSTYKPLQREGRWIEMNPHIRFGEPIVRPCGYTAYALARAIEIEGSRENAAFAYGVDVKDVEFACRYYDDLRSVNAA